MELKLKKCQDCASLVEVIRDCDCEFDEELMEEDCDCEECNCEHCDCDDCECSCCEDMDFTCGVSCCFTPMEDVVPNSTDGAVEKHVPNIEVNGETARIYVNHVMEEEHYIEAIIVMYDNEEIKHFFKPGETPEVTVPYKEGMKAYSLCNKHGLWVAE